MRYTFPLFKFLKRKHATSLLGQGQVRIGTLYEYRNAEIYSGKIHDDDEGRKQIDVYFDSVELTADELAVFGIPIGGKGKMILNDTTISLRQDSPNCYIFPTASAFFSDTLIQAVSDSKDACIMIKDPDSFFNTLSQGFDSGTYIGAFKCLYGDRLINLTWDDREYVKVLSSVPAAIIKPSKYAVQKEVRAIWLPNDQHVEPVIRTVPDITGSVIDINLDNLDVSTVFCRSQKIRIGVKVVKKSGIPSEFSIEMPNEVFTPVIFEEDGDLFLGFKSESDTEKYKSPTISRAHFGIAMTDIGPLFCVNRIEDIVQLRYFSEEIS